MPGLVSTDEADRMLRALSVKAPVARCPLEKSVGRVLREPVRADRDLPPFDRVMMDGYAVRHGVSGNLLFTVHTQQMAGEASTVLPADPYAAIEVMTGSVLPEGADTVIPYEDTQQADGGFKLADAGDVDKGQFIHRRASDYPSGTVLLHPGRLMGPVEVGIAASCGYADVAISQLPRITIFGTGDELVPVADTPAPHQIRRSNALAVSAALLGAGFPAGSTGHLVDNPEKEESRLREAIAVSDVVIISGAVSRGKRDWIPAALDQYAACRFHGVAQRPGKPMGFWQAPGGCAIFALPGNPVSTVVATHRYIIPFLRTRQCQQDAPAPMATLQRDFSFDRPLTLFLPAIVESGFAVPCPVNNSGDYAGLAGSNGFLELQAQVSHWPAGTSLPFYPWIL